MFQKYMSIEIIEVLLWDIPEIIIIFAPVYYQAFHKNFD